MSYHYEVDRFIDQIAEKIVAYRKQSQEFQRILAKEKKQITFDAIPANLKNDLLEKDFVHDIPLTQLKGINVAGVDGGVLSASLSSFDLIMVRSAGVIFAYEKDGTITPSYYPSENPPVGLYSSFLPLSSESFEQLTNIQRAHSEVECALELIDKTKPDILLMDGSLNVHPTSVPYDSSGPVFLAYQNLMRMYRRLFSNCYKRDILLAGIIKDSRSAAVGGILSKIIAHLLMQGQVQDLKKIDYRGILTRFRDLDLLNNILNPGERSFTFYQAKQMLQTVQQKEPIDISLEDQVREFQQKEMREGGAFPSIGMFYMKTVEFDLPIRVEFPIFHHGVKGIVDKIASLVLPLSSYNSEFALPSIIIEADARAKLNEVEFEIVLNEIESKSFSPLSPFYKKRNRSPFK
ncbi:MAG: DNA double-strand break repair nuclease NurA [Candidatus Kariarchaeaceae archaeon]